ncbi:uncharacterized protein VTP21DRAFT_8807 [Calcarisporiella thermophila]|uniref:uncharacterized protein n=1 Tax=Calcarisporiella thermophila TaxID=911321 RepID=UPI003742850A
MPGVSIEGLKTRVRIVKFRLREHSIILRSTKSEREVRNFERDHFIRLPEEYRMFIFDVANGGKIGPCCADGLLQLGAVPTRYIQTRERVLADMQRPFPLTMATDISRNDPQFAQVACGFLLLGRGLQRFRRSGAGRDAFWILVVEGACRGEVWWQDDLGFRPCEPRRHFLDWLEYWLDGGRDYFGKAGVENGVLGEGTGPVRSIVGDDVMDGMEEDEEENGENEEDENEDDEDEDEEGDFYVEEGDEDDETDEDSEDEDEDEGYSEESDHDVGIGLGTENSDSLVWEEEGDEETNDGYLPEASEVNTGERNRLLV